MTRHSGFNLVVDQRYLPALTLQQLSMQSAHCVYLNSCLFNAILFVPFVTYSFPPFPLFPLHSDSSILYLVVQNCNVREQCALADSRHCVTFHTSFCFTLMSVSVRPGSHVGDACTKVETGRCDVSLLVAGAHLYRFIFVLQLHVCLFKRLCDIGRSNITTRLMT